MNEELRKYLNELFADAPKTRAAYDLKEELLANSNERYLDLVQNGVSDKEAFDIVINSIGDVDQLFSSLEASEKQKPLSESTLKKTALYKSIAIGLYILGFTSMIAIDELTAFSSLGFVVMMVMVALATCILVYVGAAYPKYTKKEDTVVEEFKEWNHNQKKLKSIQGSVTAIIWMLVLILYFTISFATMAWHITWVLFLIGACAQAISHLLFQLKDFDS